ncbi:unnamed protein product [Dimorphilus gyrociliatus]|uniref:G-protein coupled receptors family 1 profile domain-containing protein n=1 Tax=Dimorphilus gyrociliatus TaxID=2664684 RepID=A0A7I8W7I2_9ANNE|nr:unnamed protein product [Dimorphilus gyrociliatus]
MAIFWLEGVATVVVVCPGLIGNILTILVLFQRSMKTSTNHFLTALAFWDSIVLIMSTLLMSVGQIIPIYKEEIHPFIVSYTYPIALISQTATIYLTVSFTVERYIAVCHPLRAASMCTRTRAKLVIGAVSLASTLYNIPRWFEYRPGYKDGKFQAVSALLLNIEKYKRIYYILYVPMMYIIPLVVLAILNTFLVRAVRESTRNHQTMNVRQHRENNVTIMLASVVVVFIVCQLPAMVYNVGYVITSNERAFEMDWAILSSVRNFSVTVNSSINFILYCAFGQKFRRTFLQTFCQKCFPADRSSAQYALVQYSKPPSSVHPRRWASTPSSSTVNRPLSGVSSYRIDNCLLATSRGNLHEDNPLPDVVVSPNTNI